MSNFEFQKSKSMQKLKKDKPFNPNEQYQGIKLRGGVSSIASLTLLLHHSAQCTEVKSGKD